MLTPHLHKIIIKDVYKCLTRVITFTQFSQFILLTTYCGKVKIPVI